MWIFWTNMPAYVQMVSLGRTVKLTRMYVCRCLLISPCVSMEGHVWMDQGPTSRAGENKTLRRNLWSVFCIIFNNIVWIVIIFWTLWAVFTTPRLYISQNHNEGPLVAIYLCLQCLWAMHAVQISVGEATVKNFSYH